MAPQIDPAEVVQEAREQGVTPWTVLRGRGIKLGYVPEEIFDQIVELILRDSLVRKMEADDKRSEGFKRARARLLERNSEVRNG